MWTLTVRFDDSASTDSLLLLQLVFIVWSFFLSHSDSSVTVKIPTVYLGGIVSIVLLRQYFLPC